jgi:hypothetical protein
MSSGAFYQTLDRDEQVELDAIAPILEKEGLPSKIKFEADDHASLMTIASVDDAETYIRDLQKQQEGEFFCYEII